MSMTKINLERALIQLPPALVLLVRRRFGRIKNHDQRQPKEPNTKAEKLNQRAVVIDDGIETVVASTIRPDPQLSGCAQERVSKCYEIVNFGDNADEYKQ